MQADKYIVANSPPTVEEYLDLRDTTGWGEIASEIVHVSLENTLFHVTIRENDKLIGMGRVIGDGVMYFYIQDVFVHPDFQGKRVGDSIMQAIEEYLLKVTKPGATVGLLSAKGKESFYIRYGYLERPNDSLGKGMCKFI